METLRAGIIGCGRPRETAGATGFGMAHWHAVGYENVPDVRIVALADLNLDNARAFQAEHGGDHLYADYHEMLARERLDLVSICTWPSLHAEMVIAASEAGVRAVHCEKPMAPSLDLARQMVAVCEASGTQLSFNHQRRFGDRFRRARHLLCEGAIGELTEIEGRCANLFDWGTHWFDMFGYFNDESPAQWVLGQIDPRDGRTVFGIHLEGQGFSHVRYANEVHGVLKTGFEAGPGPQIRLTGERGVIEIGPSRDVALRYWGRDVAPWRDVSVEEPALGVALTALGVRDLVAALREGREPELAGARALRATEAIFATYESSRLGQRVAVPMPASARTVTEYTGDTRLPG